MRGFARGFLAAVLLLLAVWLFRPFSWPSFSNLFAIKSTETTHRVVIEKMVSLGKLELTKFTFKDVVEQELVRDFLPNPKALLIVQGEAIGCIDLTKVAATDVTTVGDTLVIQMPDPELCSYYIDHSKSKIFQTEYAFMNEGLLLDEAYKRAEVQIRQSAIEGGILEQTQKNAQLVLVPLFEQVSGKKVVLRYNLKATLPLPR